MTDAGTSGDDARRHDADATDEQSVTDEQHATPSPPALGEPARPFSSTESHLADDRDRWRGSSAYSGGDGGASARQDGRPADGPPHYRQHLGGQPEYGQHLGGQPDYGQHLGGQPEYGQHLGGQPRYGQYQGGQPQYGQYQGGQPEEGRYQSRPSQAGQYQGGPHEGQPQPSYAQPQPSYAQPQPSYAQPRSSSSMSPNDEKNAGMWGHMSGLSTVLTGGLGGWIGPLIVFLIYKDRSRFVRQESREALNFGILATILAVAILLLGIVVGGLLAIFTFGLSLLLPLLWWVPAFMQVIFSIIGAVRVNNGGSYRYPINWRLVK